MRKGVDMALLDHDEGNGRTRSGDRWGPPQRERESKKEAFDLDFPG